MLANKTIKEKLDCMKKYNITHNVMLYTDVYCSIEHKEYAVVYILYNNKYWKYWKNESFDNEQIYKSDDIEIMLKNRYNQFRFIEVYDDCKLLNVHELYDKLKKSDLFWNLTNRFAITSKLIDGKLYEEYTFFVSINKVVDIVNKFIAIDNISVINKPIYITTVILELNKYFDPNIVSLIINFFKIEI